MDCPTIGGHFSSAVFDIALQNKKTLYIKSKSFSHQWFALNLYGEEQSKRALLSQHFDIALLIGMLLALVIYNFILFLSSRLKEHFYYTCYLIFGGFGVALSYGLLADLFNVYGTITVKWHLSLVVMPIFLLLFMINIFETKIKYPIEHWALLSIVTLFAINFVYGLFDIVTALAFSSTLIAVMMVVSLVVTFSMLIRKHPIAPLFLLGHGLFVVFSMLAVLFYKGKTDFNYINSHGIGIGIMLEALVLSLIIAHRMRILESLKTKQVELQLLASTDPLTQLFNRRYFKIAASDLLKKEGQVQQTSLVVMIDIDNFKKVNDTYGHIAGDKAIKAVADVIKAQCRRQDILARYGGEEFIIFMPWIIQNEAYTVTERIRKKLECTEINIEQNQFIKMTISIGIAEVGSEVAGLKNAINRADKALYRAKNNGKNQSQLFTL